MSEHDIRRPRRILRAALPSSQPAPRAQPLRHDFQTVMTRRGTDRATSQAAQALTASAPGPLATPWAAPARAAHAPAPRHEDNTAPAGAPSPRAMDSGHAMDDPVSDATASGWEQPLVDMIAGLCRAEGGLFETWTVVIPMDARVLPETDLHLSLSGQRLTLRFQTQSVEAQRVLFKHCPLLNRWLQVALPGTYSTHIDLT